MRKMRVLSRMFAALIAGCLFGCSEPPPQIAKQPVGPNAIYDPGREEWHRGWVAHRRWFGKTGYDARMKKDCCEEAIPHYLNAYKAACDAGNPGEIKRLYYLMEVYRDLAAAEGELGNEREARTNFEEALKWCDVMERYHGARRGAFYFRAYIYYLMKDYKRAEEEVLKDIQYRPDDPEKINAKLLNDIREKMETERYRVPLEESESKDSPAPPAGKP